MDKDYNKEKHRQLLQYSEDLSKQGKFLAKESKEDYLELLSYLIIYTPFYFRTSFLKN